MPPLRPLSAVTLALLLGLVLSLRFGPPPLHLAGSALVTIAAAAWLSSRLSSLKSPTDLFIFAAFGLVGALLGSASLATARLDCRGAIPDGTALHFEGRLGAASMPRDADGASPLLPLENAVITSSAGACERTVRIRLPEMTLSGGSSVEGRGEWIRTAPERGSARIDPLFLGYVATDTVSTFGSPSLARAPLLYLRGAAEARLVELFPAHYPLAQALILGRRERMDDEVKDRFVRAGLVHLLAISGAHVALFATMLLVVGTVAGMSPDRVRLGTVLVTALYLALIGAPGSAVRAGIMLSLALGARILQRPSSSLGIICAALLGLIAWDPSAVLDPGVQLSFAGVAALMLAAGVPRKALPAPLRRGLGRIVVDSVLVSIVAFVVTAPITAHHFGAVSPVSIIANLPAVPLTSLALIGVIGALAAAPLSSSLARLIADGGALALDLVDGVAEWAAAAPFGYVNVTRPDWILWVVMAAATLLVARVLAASRLTVRWGVAIGVAASILLVWPASARVGDSVEIHFLDVGQGDAIAIRTPAGRWILVDAGPRERRYDAGERRVLPFFSARGVTRLEAVILTHPHADHIGGAAAVLSALEVGRLVEPGLPTASGMYSDLLALTEKRGVAWTQARRGRSLSLDDVQLKFLWPAADAVHDGADANGVSAVVMLRYGELDALLTGDAPAEVEQELVKLEGDDLQIEILKAGHHGSKTSTSDAFLAATRPELVVISAGRRNKFGHPSPEVVDRLMAAGVEIARTDRDGTVAVRASASNGYRWERIVP